MAGLFATTPKTFKKFLTEVISRAEAGLGGKGMAADLKSRSMGQCG